MLYMGSIDENVLIEKNHLIYELTLLQLDIKVQCYHYYLGYNNQACLLPAIAAKVIPSNYTSNREIRCY